MLYFALKHLIYMKDKWFVIVNPTSGSGIAKKKWSFINKQLKNHNFNFSFQFTQFHQHAVNLSKDAINSGYRNIIAIGGDGTFHQVINGIHQTEINNIRLGIIPVGTGNDWVKTYGIPTDIKKAISIIRANFTTKQDIGKIKITSGKEIYFNNLAGVGFDAYVAKNINKFKKLGFLAYLVAGIISIFNFKKPILTIQIGDKEIIKKSKSLMLLIGICNYCGGGMRLTKDVNTKDGLFDITYVEHFGFFNILTNIHTIFNGRLTNHKLVKTFKGKTLNIINSKIQTAYIQADGELIGSGSFEVSQVKSPINFIIPEPVKS